MTVVAKLDTTRLDQITDALKPRAKRIVEEAGFSIQQKAQMNAPVDTSALHNSIMYEPTGELSGQVHDGVEYGIFQELGTSKMRAQPFLIPAVESERAAFNAAWNELFL